MPQDTFPEGPAGRTQCSRSLAGLPGVGPWAPAASIHSESHRGPPRGPSCDCPGEEPRPQALAPGTESGFQEGGTVTLQDTGRSL